VRFARERRPLLAGSPTVPHSGVVQSVERSPHKGVVGGSSPPAATVQTDRACRGRSASWTPGGNRYTRGSRAADLMLELKPLMSTRRREQIDKAVKSYTRYRYGTLPPSIVQTVKQRVSEGCNKSQPCTAHWGRSSEVERCLVRAEGDGSIPFVPASILSRNIGRWARTRVRVINHS
jgi:hypothetical protein